MWDRGDAAFKAALAAGCALALCGCAPEPPPPEPYRPVLDMHDLMARVLDPATDVVWGAAGAVVTAEGERDLAPTTDEGWSAVIDAAAIVAETGNLLMLPGRAVDDGAWREYSLALVATGQEAMAAAAAHDSDAVFDIGGRLYNICVACHLAYDMEDADAAGPEG